MDKYAGSPRDGSPAQAMRMLDTLVAIKIDLTAEVLPSHGELADLRDRLHRACLALDGAIAELKQLPALSTHEQKVPGQGSDREPFSSNRGEPPREGTSQR